MSRTRALMALVRLEVSSTSRTRALLAARTTLAVLSAVSVLGVLMLYSFAPTPPFGPMLRISVERMAWVGMMLMTPALAVAVLERERSESTEDLLALTGLSSRLVAMGRTIAVWASLVMLVGVAGPAWGLTTFFWPVSATRALYTLLVVGSEAALLASLAVAAAAWTRRPGSAAGAAAGACALLMAWTSWPVLSGGSSAAGSLPWLLHLDRLEWRAPRLTGPVVAMIAGRLVLALALVPVAGHGLARRRTLVHGDALAARLPAPLRASARAHSATPLTWIAQRVHAPLRPSVQAALLVLLIAALALGRLVTRLVPSLSPHGVPPLRELWAPASLVLLVTGLAAALGASLAAVAGEREGNRWDAVTLLPRSAAGLLGDLLWASARASALPVAAGLASLDGSLTLQRASSSAIAGVTLVGVATWLLCLMLGLAWSCVSRTFLRALLGSLACLVAILVLPAPGDAVGGLLAVTGGASALVLVPVMALLAWFLVRSARRHAAVGLLIAALLTGMLGMLVIATTGSGQAVGLFARAWQVVEGSPQAWEARGAHDTLFLTAAIRALAAVVVPMHVFVYRERVLGRVA